MVCQLPPLRIGAVSQPCTGRKGLAALAKIKHGNNGPTLILNITVLDL